MTRAAVLALVLLAGGCTPRQLRAVSVGGAVLAGAALTTDWCQTRSGRRQGLVETGVARLAIGARPSEGAVDAYFLGSALVTVAVAELLLPERWRPWLYGAVAGGELATVAGNAPFTSARCL